MSARDTPGVSLRLTTRKVLSPLLTVSGAASRPTQLPSPLQLPLNKPKVAAAVSFVRSHTKRGGRAWRDTTLDCGLHGRGL